MHQSRVGPGAASTAPRTEMAPNVSENKIASKSAAAQGPFASRVTVANDGAAIMLKILLGDGALAAALISPAEAVRLSRDLLQAAGKRLGSAVQR
jgi:hypothetical protein